MGPLKISTVQIRSEKAVGIVDELNRFNPYNSILKKQRMPCQDLIG